MPNSTTMRIVEIELSALRFSALLTSAIRPVATWETTAIDDQRQQRDDRAAEDDQQQDQDQHERGEQHDLLGLVAGLLAVELLGRRPVTPSSRPVPAISGLMIRAQCLDRVAGRVPEPLTTLLGMATIAVCTRRFGDARSGRDAHDVRDVLAVQRRSRSR